MARLIDAYRATHEQGFLPIFTDDEFDSGMLVEACIEAGCRVIEYTLRRPDAHTMIPKVLEAHPDLFILVGSTLDDETIVRKMRPRHPQLMTIPELAKLDVDGFVSMLGYRLDTIRRYAKSHILAVSAMTVTEALQQVGAGAHFIKMGGSDLGLVRRVRNDAAFDFCPVLVTGGMSAENIPAAVDAGAVLVGAGFDLILKGKSADISRQEVAAEIRKCLSAAQESRKVRWPLLAGSDVEERNWLDSLPHYHPF